MYDTCVYHAFDGIFLLIIIIIIIIIQSSSGATGLAINVSSRAFPVAGPKTWNALLEDATSSQSEYTSTASSKRGFSRSLFLILPAS